MLENQMNHLASLKEVLDKVAQQKQRMHIEINYDGCKFYWGVTVGSLSACQLDTLFNITDNPVPDSPVLPVSDSSSVVHNLKEKKNGT